MKYYTYATLNDCLTNIIKLTKTKKKNHLQLEFVNKKA